VKARLCAEEMTRCSTAHIQLGFHVDRIRSDVFLVS